MSRPLVLLGAIDGHAATVIAHLLEALESRALPHDAVATFTPGPDDGPVRLVVVQSRTEKTAEIVRVCQAIRANPALADARLLVALDPDLAGQYSAIRAAGADECLMVPASAGHVEKLLQKLLPAED